jgi:hypothetical protein
LPIFPAKCRAACDIHSALEHLSPFLPCLWAVLSVCCADPIAVTGLAADMLCLVAKGSVIVVGPATPSTLTSKATYLRGAPPQLNPTPLIAGHPGAWRLEPISQITQHGLRAVPQVPICPSCIPYPGPAPIKSLRSHHPSWRDCDPLKDLWPMRSGSPVLVSSNQNSSFPTIQEEWPL